VLTPEGLVPEQEALEIQKRTVASDTPDRAWVLAELGLAALARGRPEAALAQLDAASAHGLTPDMVSAIRSDATWRRLAADDPRFVRWVARASETELGTSETR
jgi:hypothetical protein